MSFQFPKYISRALVNSEFCFTLEWGLEDFSDAFMMSVNYTRIIFRLSNLYPRDVCVTVAAATNIDVNTRPHPWKTICKSPGDCNTHWSKALLPWPLHSISTTITFPTPSRFLDGNCSSQHGEMQKCVVYDLLLVPREVPLIQWELASSPVTQQP